MDKNGDTILDDPAHGRSGRWLELLSRSNPTPDCIRRGRNLVSFDRDTESAGCVRGRSKFPLIGHGDTREGAGKWPVLFVYHDASDQSVVARLSEGTSAATTSVLLAGAERRQKSCKYEARCAKHGGYGNGRARPAKYTLNRRTQRAVNRPRISCGDFLVLTI